MIGISFSYPDAADQFRDPPWLELRVARVEPDVRSEDTYYWRSWELPLEERERLMDAVTKLVREHKIDGLTLWWNFTTRVWQMNVRHEGEAWSINYISQADAEKIFATLEAAHPDGPWNVKKYVQDDKAAADEVRKQVSSTAHARVERTIEDAFDAVIVEPDDLMALLSRVEAAVARGSVALGRVVA